MESSTINPPGPARISRLQRRLDRGRTKIDLERLIDAAWEERELNNLRSELGARIRERFPSMPAAVLKQIVDYYSDPEFQSPYKDEKGLTGEWRTRIYKLVEAWARHQMTDYDEILASTGVGGAQNKKAARALVRDELRAILRQWRRRKKS